MNWLLIYIFFLHWLGDFVLQTNWMALNKSKNNWALTAHVGVYSFWLAIGLLPCGWGGLWLALINGACHWGTDYLTSRASSRLWQANQRHWFWVMVGFDQFVHVATLTFFAKCFLA